MELLPSDDRTALRHGAASAQPPDPPAYESDAQCDCDCDCACLLDSFAQRSTLPRTYYLELTPDCNNRCPGCGNVFLSDSAPRIPSIAACPLDAAGWVAVLDLICGHAESLKLTGGEPTRHPEFADIVQAVGRRGVPFTLFSNGRWVDPPGVVGLLRRVSQCLGLLISLHGSTAAAHEAFSGVAGSFAETCENIQLAARSGLAVAVSVVLTRQNASQIAEIVAYARALGARQVVFNRYLGTPVQEIALTNEELQRAVRRVEELREAGEHVKFGACIPACFTPSSARGCAAGIAFATIDPWGNVRPCNHTPLIVGNLLRQSIAEIWSAAEWGQWEALVPRQCHRCEAFIACHGGCRAMALASDKRRDPLIGRPFIQPSARSGSDRPLARSSA